MNYKDCQEWRKVGFPAVNTSNEAAKMYDAAMTQYLSGYSDETVGNMGTCLQKMLTADPDFVLGHVVKNGLMLLGGPNVWTNNDMKINIDKMVEMAEKADLNPLEKLHVDAVKHLSLGESTSACDKWDEILLYYPTDILALRNAFSAHFVTGRIERYRDCFARVMPDWKASPSPILYSNVRSMYAFSLEETNFYDEAEKLAREGFEVNQKDIWATHTLAHIMEMQGRNNEGVTFLRGKEQDFQGNVLCGHVYWHWGLFHIEKGEYEEALSLYDGQVQKFMDSGLTIDLTDASAFLYRLELEGVDVGDRWKNVYEHWSPRIGDHALMFDDIHSLMAAQGAKQDDVADKLMESLKEFISNTDDRNHNTRISKEVGLSLCKAFQAYDNGDYGTAVDAMVPIKYRIQELGGSHAQRDIFNLFLIHAAVKSSEKKHQLLARSLLQERKAQRKCSPMTDRILAQLGDISSH
ncbi:tetratricopeptide repeat protein 38-like [Ptychodera flava]|uniref:tetratricopeptide repeat protein 38-like n=1 Tax=Ptychodera flava TaxID=63121 RepID=UPI00396A2A08